jgi:hypothetical protein
VELRGKRNAPGLAPAALGFKVIQDRFVEPIVGADRRTVEERFGPPTVENAWEPDFPAIEASVERWSRHYPDRWVWAKWVDPEDDRQWIAVLFSGDLAYDNLKKGW